jgi:hypothetical protein
MDELDVANSAVSDKKSKSSKSVKKPAGKRKAAAPKTTRVTKKATLINISEDQRLSMIAETAYLKAEKRGFSGGNPVDDWLAAESEVDTLLSSHPVQHAKA